MKNFRVVADSSCLIGLAQINLFHLLKELFSEVYIRLFEHPVSIKTIAGSGGVKVIWTVDAPKALEFFNSYTPSCEILLAQIKWDLKETDFQKGVHPGGHFLIPVET